LKFFVETKIMKIQTYYYFTGIQLIPLPIVVESGINC